MAGAAAEESSSGFQTSSGISTHNTMTVRRKHRFTIFIGYGDEAGKVLKSFEQLKCRLGIATNILFLNFLLQYFEDHSKTKENSVNEPNNCTSNNETSNGNISDFVINDIGRIPVCTKELEHHHNHNHQPNNISVAKLSLTPSSPHDLPQKQHHQQQHSSRASFGEEHQQQEEGNPSMVHSSAAIVATGSIIDNDCKSNKILSPLPQQEKNTNHFQIHEDDQHKKSTTLTDKQQITVTHHYQMAMNEQQQQQQNQKDQSDEYLKNVIHTAADKIIPIENLFVASILAGSPVTVASELSNSSNAAVYTSSSPSQEYQTTYLENEEGNYYTQHHNHKQQEQQQQQIRNDDLSSDQEALLPPPAKIPKLLNEDINAASLKNNEDDALILFQRNAINILHEYLEHIKRELNYYHGYISSTEKLRVFLNKYREATNMCFTVRSSRSYIKKKNLITSKPDEQVVHDVHSAFEEETTIDNTGISKDTKLMPPLSQFSTMCKENSSQQLPNESLLDRLITGPLRWEFILGKPPIPFTGIPFFIIGNTHYQCRYACPDIRTQRRRAHSENSLKDQTSKIRARKSLKRDCKAVMCIKSIVAFPDFTVEDKINGVKSKKGCRKIKAAALETVRKSVEKGEAVGHPAFWVCIPLPEAHTTHDLSSDSDTAQNEAQVSQESESIDAIAHILHVAAQYGGKIEILQHVEENMEFELTTTDGNAASVNTVDDKNNEKLEQKTHQKQEDN